MTSQALSERRQADSAYRKAVFRALLLLTAAGGLLFSFLNFSDGITSLAVIELVLVAYALGMLYVIPRSSNLRCWILAFLIPFLAVMMFAFAHPETSSKVFIWVLLIPLVAHLLVGRLLGISLSIGFVVIAGAIYLWRFQNDPSLINAMELSNVGLCTLTILIVSHLYELTRERSEARLRRLATTDGLTGLANRTRFSDVFTWERHKALRENTPLSLILIDLDHFKSVNDSYGHEAGDLVLKHISTLIGGRLRSTDLLCRMGGEEFAVMVANVELSLVEHLTRELQKVVAETPCIVVGVELRVTFSAGIAQLGRDGGDLRSLFSAADRRLYQSKAAGRNCISSTDQPATASAGTVPGATVLRAVASD